MTDKIIQFPGMHQSVKEDEREISVEEVIRQLGEANLTNLIVLGQKEPNLREWWMSWPNHSTAILEAIRLVAFFLVRDALKTIKSLDGDDKK